MFLILDSSSQTLTTILVKEDGSFLQGQSWNAKHQQHLLPEVESLLCKANVNVNSLQVIACVAGPGSFTGARLAVATTKGFCLVNKSAKVVCLNLLDLLAEKILKLGKKNFAVATKCTSSKLYVSICENNQTKQFVCSNQEFLNFCKENNLEMFGFEMPEIAEQKLSQVALEAKDYVEFASKQIEAQNFVLPSKLEPIYMALSQAEEELLKREKNAQHSQG